MTDPGVTTEVVAGVVVLLNGLLFALLPRLTRPEIYFAVTVPADLRDSAEGRHIARRFRAWVLAATGLALAVLAAAQARFGATELAGLVVVAQLAALLPAFLQARHATLRFSAEPRTVREASLEPRPAWGWGELVLHAGPVAAVVAAGIVTVTRWSELPARVPVHWGLDGSPDQWTARTPANVGALLLSVAAVAAALSFIAWFVGRGLRHVQRQGPAARAERRFQRVMRAVTLIAAYLVAAPAGILALTTFGVQVRSPLVWLVPTVVLLACVGVAVWWGQGGSRLAAGEAAGEAPPRPPVGDRSEDRRWKLGLLYVNRGDPALLVEKRFGIGYTLNFGNPWSWLLLGVLVGVPLLLALLSAGAR